MKRTPPPLPTVYKIEAFIAIEEATFFQYDSLDVINL